MLADGLIEEVALLDAAKNLGDWYRITQKAADSVSKSIIASSARQAEKELDSIAAAILGQKGGL